MATRLRLIVLSPRVSQIGCGPGPAPAPNPGAPGPTMFGSRSANPLVLDGAQLQRLFCASNPCLLQVWGKFARMLGKRRFDEKALVAKKTCIDTYTRNQTGLHPTLGKGFGVPGMPSQTSTTVNAPVEERIDIQLKLQRTGFQNFLTEFLNDFKNYLTVLKVFTLTKFCGKN